MRTLGVPTVADRIAQTVVAMSLEPRFHSRSYGYRPGRSALDAVAVCRDRCWQEDWVLDLDIRSFFDSVPWEPILKAVAHHTDERWIILYVQRWLEAPLQSEDGSLSERDRGTPQGSAVSPLLANMFLHYAFDAWMATEFPGVRVDRYCDDIGRKFVGFSRRSVATSASASGGRSAAGACTVARTRPSPTSPTRST